MTLDEEVRRAAFAREAKENPLIVDALDEYEERITEAWKTSPLRDVEGREKLRLQLEASKSFRQYLETTMETGRLAEEQIRQKTLMDRMRAPFGRG